MWSKSLPNVIFIGNYDYFSDFALYIIVSVFLLFDVGKAGAGSEEKE